MQCTLLCPTKFQKEESEDQNSITNGA